MEHGQTTDGSVFEPDALTAIKSVRAVEAGPMHTIVSTMKGGAIGFGHNVFSQCGHDEHTPSPCVGPRFQRMTITR